MATASPGRYFPGLNGVRALAIFLVIAFHLNFAVFKGGYLGVDVFFVLSGFLITYLLLEEFKRNNTISFSNFWARRAKRLLPGLFVMLVILSIAETIDPRLTSPSYLLTSSFFTILYVQNWHILISAPSSYFSNIYASPLIHTWSLSVEEQFYLFWPFVFVLLLKASIKTNKPIESKRRLLCGMLIMIGVSYTSMAIVLLMTHNVEQIYYNSFFRAYELLSGAAVAVLISFDIQASHKKKRFPQANNKLSSPAKHIILNIITLLLFAIVIVIATHFGDTNEISYLLATPIICFSTATLIFFIVKLPRSLLTHMLELAPMNFIGKISYSLYLWHWPIIALITPAQVSVDGYKLKLLQVALTIIVACLSYYLVEAPLRVANYKGLLKKLTFILPPIGILTSLWFVNQSALASFYNNSPKTISITTSRSYKPYRVAFIGDSVMYQESVALSAAFSSTGEFTTVYNAAWPGWGLTEDQSHLELDLFGVQTRGANTVFAMWTMDNSFLANATSNQLANYQDTFNNFINSLIQIHVNYIIFLQQPPLPPSNSLAAIDSFAGWNETGRRIWDNMALRAAEMDPAHVIYASVANSLTVNGHFSWFLPDPFKNGVMARARQLDGLHLCPIGAGYYAQATLEYVSRQLSLPSPRYNWWLTSWIDAKRFNQIPGGQPPGQCPDAYGT